ncbi:hypothetical protein N7G274_006144 [Stereocaulon virgatum]|uniref:Uncharacterized protein n=1 Tax=Stereocaulon virgatum TaxID=373712 RepID=A0ABR4A6S8_9LECA
MVFHSYRAGAMPMEGMEGMGDEKAAKHDDTHGFGLLEQSDWAEKGRRAMRKQKKTFAQKGQGELQRTLETGIVKLGPKEAHVILDRVEIGQTINHLDGFSVSQF